MEGRLHSSAGSTPQPISYLIEDREGSALVEFVLVAQLLLLLLFGLVDMALLLNTRLVMTHAAREGLRRAAIEGGATAVVYEQLNNQLRLGALDVERAQIVVKPKHASYGTQITVSISYDFQPVTPMMRALFGEDIPLRTELVGRSERLR